ncbi:GGDEF domain-containing protein [Shewanella sedimentimangrovi]|uniref:diguanylate cyclase n=1 Tax=Shewanella sedimentimangrovi TaxID=2814293 RepID=A0ABX7QYG8_9GAMM|nr:GGDEF domain-containing protein [Shewanella sedimentimangrovi]QSX35661.1 GGDEF domain-containing protein [Shewanella sedimentimangrovi]
MLQTAIEEKTWILVKYAHALVRPLSIVCILFGFTAIAGYFGSVEAFYRPITNGPATNPLTAICMIFIGFGLRGDYNKPRVLLLQRALALMVIIITSTRFFDVLFNADVSESITPFQRQVALDLQMGKSNNMGINSAIMFFCIALSLQLYGFKRFIASQFVAFIALAIPTISFTGYAYGIDQFYGQMSMLTASTGFALAVAALVMTANFGAVKAILSPYVGGKIARLQTIAGYAIPTLLGYLLIKSLNSNDGNLFGVFVVTICWFIILMVSMSAIFQEKIDHERRIGEFLLTQAAMNDQLTGLANRRKFLEFGQEELCRVQRNGGLFWLLILDVDYFKKINDTAGHDMGDRILVKFGETLRNSVRTVDLVSRIGGEEFAIVLVDTSRRGAERVADNIRSNIANIYVEGWTDIHGPITVSIGCTANDGSQTLEESLKAADQALYQAKQSGRDRVCFADDSECQ